MVSEKQIEAYFVKRIKKIGGISYKWTSPGTVGVPDRIMILGNAVYFVELKTKTGRVSPAQKKVHKELVKHGADVLILWSKEDVDELIRIYENSIPVP